MLPGRTHQGRSRPLAKGGSVTVQAALTEPRPQARGLDVRSTPTLPLRKGSDTTIRTPTPRYWCLRYKKLHRHVLAFVRFPTRSLASVRPSPLIAMPDTQTSSMARLTTVPAWRVYAIVSPGSVRARRRLPHSRQPYSLGSACRCSLPAVGYTHSSFHPVACVKEISM